MWKKLLVFTDGGARGNPGPAAAGVIVKDDQGKTLFRVGEYLGHKTNNEAEYEAILVALDWLEKNVILIQEIHFYFDSQLITEQLKGNWRVKAVNLQPLVLKAKQRMAALQKPVFFSHLPREENRLADRLVNFTLDEVERRR